VIGDCRFAIADSRLPIGDWRLAIGDWRLPIGDCRLAIADWRLAIGDWRLPIEVTRFKSAIDNRQSEIQLPMTLQIANRQSAIGNSLWWLVTVCVSRDAEESASALLFDLGSTGIVTLDETAESVKVGAYFDGAKDTDDIKRTIEAEFARAGRPDALSSVSISSVPEQDWMQKWKEGFEAIEIGSRLVVAPSWKLPGKSDGRVVIQIDPGMAFGTGTHETTRLCLEAIERHWQGGSLLDVGTGTGILAIAAALLAPGSRVAAIDVDPQAVEVARENLAINGVSSSIELLEAQPRNLTGQEFNVVVANLTAEVIIDLMTDLARCVTGNGAMILSGILSELAEDVARALEACGFNVTERREAGEWCAFVAIRN
jgi:ribosomal protein L11 methyltransferase